MFSTHTEEPPVLNDFSQIFRENLAFEHNMLRRSLSILGPREITHT